MPEAWRPTEKQDRTLGLRQILGMKELNLQIKLEEKLKYDETEVMPSLEREELQRNDGQEKDGSKETVQHPAGLVGGQTGQQKSENYGKRTNPMGGPSPLGSCAGLDTQGR